ncbi:MAG: acyl-CoA dehydrogenase [Gammaproteobacteria bacterium]|nr:MAG: acyl-CoA dehydrogenase [Gammaproteobacteria bacterium]
MRFGLSEEQKMLGDMLNKYLDANLTLEDIRISAQQSIHHNPDIWQGLIDQGTLGIIIPEEYGGAGLSMLHAEVVSELLGRRIVPVSYLGHAILAPLAIQHAGTPAQAGRMLPEIASGDVTYGIALTDVVANRENACLTIKSDRVSGDATFVIGGETADKLVLASPGTLIVVERNAPGVEVEVLTTVDKTRDFSVVHLNDAPCEVLGGVGSSEQAIETVLNAARIHIAADTLGAVDAMFEQALEYSRTREQFDRPIGSFQSIKHILAEMVTDIEPCRSLIWYAAYAFDEVPEEATLIACHAKAHMAEVAKHVNRATTEMHGGMGFTDLLGLHFWFKRIEVNRQLLGGPEVSRHYAAVSQGWATGGISSVTNPAATSASTASHSTKSSAV